MPSSTPSKLRFSVEGMTCGGCARTVRQALEAIPGLEVERVVAGQPVEVALDGDTIDEQTVFDAIERAGYRPTPSP